MRVDQIQAKRQAKQARREKRKSELEAQAAKRLEVRGAPNHAMTHSELLQMRIQVADLTHGHNQVSRVVSRYEAGKIEERATEAHYMMQAIVTALVERGLFSLDELKTRCEQLQQQDMGLVDKSNGVLEDKDLALIKFKLRKGDEVVDDQTKAPLLYEMGTRGMPCEAEMVGMRVGETKTMSVVFGRGFRLAHLVGVPLEIDMHLVGVKASHQQR